MIFIIINNTFICCVISLFRWIRDTLTLVFSAHPNTTVHDFRHCRAQWRKSCDIELKVIRLLTESLDGLTVNVRGQYGVILLANVDCRVATVVQLSTMYTFVISLHTRLCDVNYNKYFVLCNDSETQRALVSPSRQQTIVSAITAAETICVFPCPMPIEQPAQPKGLHNRPTSTKHWHVFRLL